MKIKDFKRGLKKNSSNSDEDIRKIERRYGKLETLEDKLTAISLLRRSNHQPVISDMVKKLEGHNLEK